MDNFDKLHADQDAFIKGVFHEDKLVSQPVLDSFEQYLEKTKIKADKYTHKQKKVILLLIILLLISVGYNVYLTLFPRAEKTEKEENKPVSSSSVLLDNKDEEESTQPEIDDIVEVDRNEITDNTNTNVVDTNTTVENTQTNTVTNTVDNTAVENEVTNNVAIANVTKVPTVEKDYTNEFNVEEFTKTLEKYALGINRIKDTTDDLESNTILLAITKNFFNTHSNASGIAVDTKYAQTVANMHKYIEELTGRDLPEKYIPSYNNIIGYAFNTKSYLYGKDISILQKETYKVSDLKVSEKSKDGTYHATAKITRTLDYIDTVYEVDVDFKINSNYTYQPYCIISLKAKNTSFYPDNTVHFVEK